MCCFAVDTHRGFISLPICLYRKSREARDLMGVWKKRTSSQTWIQNHKALANSGSCTPVCLFVSMPRRDHSSPRSCFDLLYRLSYALVQAHSTPPFSKDWCRSCWCKLLRATTKLNTGTTTWESTTPTRKKSEGRKGCECCILGFIPSLSPHLESHDLSVLPGHLSLSVVSKA